MHTTSNGDFDLDRLQKLAADWPGLEGMDLAKEVSRLQVERWTGGKWQWGEGYEMGGDDESRPHVVAVDYGNKRNIFRNLVEAGARVTVVPATASFDEIMAHEPDGFFLSNGPGDPAATGEYAVPVIRQMLETKKPLFGICLGHQMLALAVGGKTAKMFQGHRGANHPVKRLEDGRVEITSMNHGFAVEREGLPENVRETHVSLFDDSNCGIELTDRPAFSVQYHPEASPGPQDSFYLFEKFVKQMWRNAMLEAVPAPPPVIFVQEVRSNEPAMLLGFMAVGSRGRHGRGSETQRLPISNSRQVELQATKNEPEVMVMLSAGRRSFGRICSFIVKRSPENSAS